MKRSKQQRDDSRRKGWKLLLWGALCGGVLVLLWWGWHYTQPTNFPLKRVRIVSSYNNVKPEVLRKVIAAYTEQGFFYLNVLGLKRQLLQLPWVNAVVIQRAWPDTITVTIVEEEPLLQWGTTALVNRAGKLFTPPPATFPPGLPIIFGPREQVASIFQLYQVAQQLLHPLALTVQRLTLTPQHYWELILSNNSIIYLKEEEPIAQLQLLVSLYKKITAGHKEAPQAIDLRYNTPGLAVRW